MPEAVAEIGVISDDVRRILTDLCEGHPEGELTVGPARKPTACVQIRFLRLEGDRLEVDLPNVHDIPLEVAKGDAVVLKFVWHDQLYLLPARLRRRLPSPSAGPSCFDILHFDQFAALKRIQRRETYRLSLLELPPPLISFSRSGEPAGATGSLIELSETGGRALVAQDLMPFLTQSDTCRASFELPEQGEPFEFQARLARVIGSDDDVLMVVGLSWELDGSWSEARRLQDRVAKFVAQRQRTGRGRRA